VSDSWIAQPGLILFTENFVRCVDFYRDLLGLPVVFDNGPVIALRFGSGYLMIEGEGSAAPTGRALAQSPVTLRFNVPDVEAAAVMLRDKGIAVVVSSHDWGVVGDFLDPDGNRCQLRNHTAEFFAGAATPAR
jgi:lactoylglutathione lyase